MYIEEEIRRRKIEQLKDRYYTIRWQYSVAKGRLDVIREEYEKQERYVEELRRMLENIKNELRRLGEVV